MQATRIALIAAAALIAAFPAFDLGQRFRLEYFKSQQAAIDLYCRANPLVAALAFFTLYVVLTAVPLPVAGIMTPAAGAIFGLAWGTVIVFVASGLCTVHIYPCRVRGGQACGRGHGSAIMRRRHSSPGWRRSAYGGEGE